MILKADGSKRRRGYTEKGENLPMVERERRVRMILGNVSRCKFVLLLKGATPSSPKSEQFTGKP